MDTAALLVGHAAAVQVRGLGGLGLFGIVWVVFSPYSLGVSMSFSGDWDCLGVVFFRFSVWVF